MMIQGVCSGIPHQRCRVARTMSRAKLCVRWLIRCYQVLHCINGADSAEWVPAGHLCIASCRCRPVRDNRWFHRPSDASVGLLQESGWNSMAGARGCLLLACLLVAAGAQTSAAATAADQAGLLQNTWRQGSLMGSTHIRQLKVGRCRHIHLVHMTVHLCARCLRIASCPSAGCPSSPRSEAAAVGDLEAWRPPHTEDYHNFTCRCWVQHPPLPSQPHTAYQRCVLLADVTA